MKTVYFNLRTNYGVETVDELSQIDFVDFRAFWNEVRRLLNEYHMAGMPVYRSQRCTNEWRDRS